MSKSSPIGNSENFELSFQLGLTADEHANLCGLTMSHEIYKRFDEKI